MCGTKTCFIFTVVASRERRDCPEFHGLLSAGMWLAQRRDEGTSWSNGGHPLGGRELPRLAPSAASGPPLSSSSLQNTYLYEPLANPVRTVISSFSLRCQQWTKAMFSFSHVCFLIMNFWRKCYWTRRNGFSMVRLQVHNEILEDKLCFKKHCLNKLWQTGGCGGRTGVQAAVFSIQEHFILFRTREAFLLILHREASGHFTTLISFPGWSIINLKAPLPSLHNVFSSQG